ncbi:MAG: EAL domain-containing protein [Corynebacteriales bacterium]|nr:EAL domain-containing protein [Mycobacteriales bacterium]
MALSQSADLRLRALFESSAIGVGLADMTGAILEANPALTKMLGSSIDELRRRHVTDFTHPDDEPDVWRPLQALLNGELENYEMEKRYLGTEGTTAWIRVLASTLRDERGTPTHILAVFDDVTEQHLAQERLSYLARHCPLTGLHNRAHFMQELSVACQSDHDSVALCYLDIDDFRLINDRYGHEIADRLLISVSRRIQHTAGPEAVIARLGGDEFGLLLTGTHALTMTPVAEKILHALRQPFQVEEREIFVSASLGVVHRCTPSADPYQLLRDADTTMYWAKAAGKACLAHFDVQRSKREAQSYMVAAAMPEALTNNEFFVQYQPFFALDTRKVIGVEALIRWQHPMLGRLEPDFFLSLAEKTGFIFPLSRWMLDTVCTQLRQWKAAGLWTDEMKLCINAAPRQVQDPNFVQDIKVALEAHEIPASALQIDITEQAFTRDVCRIAGALRALADEGVTISIDDFGTGYSNLAYLAELPIHTLKIAGTFVNRLTNTHGKDAQLIAGLIEIANTLGLSVSAECIETAAQARHMRQLGCLMGQGWHLARPVAAEDVPKQLAGAIQGTL